MEKVHIYYSTTITIAYDVEVPDGIDSGQLGDLLMQSEDFYEHHIVADLCNADWNDVETDCDGWVDDDYTDFTAEQVLGFIGKE